MERPKRRVLNLAEEKLLRVDRQLAKMIGVGGMYPLNAPGMPPPGPNFRRAAMAMGDTTEYVKPTKDKEEKYLPGEVLAGLYKRALREPGFTLSVQMRPGVFKDAVFVPGHIWGEGYDQWSASLSDIKITPPPVTGPARADVMVIGKMPWREESKEGRNFIGDTGRILIESCARHRIKNIRKWYICNLLKFKPPDDSTILKADWIKDCLPLLHQELRIVRPKYILFLGADASKELLGDKATVTHMQGRVSPYAYPVHLHGDKVELHTAQCMTVLHPAVVARAQGPHEGRQLDRGISRFAQLISGADFTQAEDLDHRTCTSLEEAQDWVHEVAMEMAKQPKALRILGVDAEWEGQHAVNKNAWVATIQVSWAERKSMCFHLRDEQGKTAFRDCDGKPALKRLAKLLTKHVNKYRIAGHFFVSDLEMLVAEGFDFRAGYAVPAEDAEDGTPAWMRCMNGEGGLDTAMMAHAVEETGMLGLESIILRYTSILPYWVPVEEAVQQLCKDLGIKRSALEGYGRLPRDILIPYGNYDADGTRRAAVMLLKYLSEDYDGNNCWESFWESMIVQPVILEMHQNGIYADRKRIDENTVKFLAARTALEARIKEAAKWPDPPDGMDKEDKWPAFNVRSTQHVKEYLYGEKLNGKVTKSGGVVRLRPPGAVSLNVTPILDTAKPPKKWSEIVEQGKVDEHAPSTAKGVLAVLAQENLEVATQINQIRDYRFLDQVLKSVLRPPATDDDGEWIYEADSEDLSSQGLLVYDAGLAACIDDDGMVRTHLYPTAETGRWKSARPNLQNISKTRDPDYERLLVDEEGKTLYKHKLRSIFSVPTAKAAVPVVKWKNNKKEVVKEKGDWVLIESDLKGAELYGMALMSGSKKMIDHAKRSIDYPDEGYDVTGNEKCTCGPGGKRDRKCDKHKYPHKEYYDIHSNVAVMAFKLSCHPSKAGLKDAKKGHLRNIAKTVIFGIAYGRQAKAIALAAKEQRKPGEPEVTVEDAQAVIDAVFAMYPELVPFFAEARSRSLNEKWLCNCFGRLRRFPQALDYKLEGEFERQAMNYPIQSMIASLVDRWLSTLHIARERLLPTFKEHIFQWQLQIHDALLIRCRPKYVKYIVTTLLPWSVQQIPIFPTKLDGSPIEGRGPYYLGTETDVYGHWGEKLSVEECKRMGVPLEFAA